MNVKDVGIYGSHVLKNLWYAQNVKTLTGIKKEKMEIGKMGIVKEINPVLLVKRERILPSGKQMLVLRRDNTITNIFRRAYNADNRL